MGRGIAVGRSRNFSSFLRPISPFPFLISPFPVPPLYNYPFRTPSGVVLKGGTGNREMRNEKRRNEKWRNGKRRNEIKKKQKWKGENVSYTRNVFLVLELN